VEGLSGEPLPGAQLALDGNPAGTSGVDGRFELAAVPRGNHALQITAPGYGTANYSFILPPGATPSLGDLALFAATSDEAATTLTLVGLVVDGLDNRPLADATVTLAQTGTTVTTDTQGRFVRSFGAVASGYGEVAGTFALPPIGGDPAATASTLRGVVRDSVSGAALANASIRISGTAEATTSAADGSFELTGIANRDFTLLASLTGYGARSYDMQIGQHGVYAIDIALTREPGAVEDLFDVVSLSPLQGASGAHTQQRFAARISNLTNEERSALILADVLDATGRTVASTMPFAADTETPTSVFTFAAAQTLELTLPWNTAQFAPGSYSVRLRLVEPGTISRDIPSGVVRAQ
jgi:hypothetical protein